MDNKKLGVVLLLISFLVGLVVVGFMNELRESSKALNCYPDNECAEIEFMLSISHLGVGVIAFIFSLGLYLIFFTKGEEAIVKRLQEDKSKELKADKFNIMLKMLDENEQKVLKAIKNQDGISQNTLVLRTGLSRSKVSEVLRGFEDKKLIKREDNGRTRSIYLTEAV